MNDSTHGLIQGVQVALVTPLGTSPLRPVNLDGLQSHCATLVTAGVSGLVPCGTTGETSTLTHDECAQVIAAAVSVCKGTSTKVIAGTGSNSTAEAVMMTEKAAQLGADAALIVTPYYNRPTRTGLIQHFRELDRVGLPLVLYNIPSRTGINLEPEFVKEVFDSCDNVVGMKASNGNIDEMIQLLNITRDDANKFSLLSGDDSLTLPIMAIGGTGVISVAANIIPKTMCLLVSSVEAGDYMTARRIAWAIHTFVRRLLIVGSNPEPIKSIMNSKGFDVGGCRLPLSDISPESLDSLRSDLVHIRETLGRDLSPDTVFEAI